MRESFNFFHPVTVRWADMDSFSHVNNAVYFTYCESARMAYFAAVRLDDARSKPSLGPALAQASLNFRRQVHYPAELEVGARATGVSGRSFQLDYAIFVAGSDEIVADGSSVVVWVDYEVGKSVPLPDDLKERIYDLDPASRPGGAPETSKGSSQDHSTEKPR